MNNSVLTLKLVPDALKLDIPKVQVSGYFYTVDLGEGVSPRQHYIESSGCCTCYLGDQCPAVEMVQEYLTNGGDPAPEPPAGYYPAAPVKCPICGAQTVYDKSLSSKKRGAGWRCAESGSAHYWQKMGRVLQEKFAANPWLFPPVVIRDKAQVAAWEGIQEGDRVLAPGLLRAETI